MSHKTRLGTPLIGLAESLGDSERPAGHLYHGIRQYLWSRPGRLGTLDEDAVSRSVEDLALAVGDAMEVPLSEARVMVAAACRSDDDGWFAERVA